MWSQLLYCATTFSIYGGEIASSTEQRKPLYINNWSDYEMGLFWSGFWKKPNGLIRPNRGTMFEIFELLKLVQWDVFISSNTSLLVIPRLGLEMLLDKLTVVLNFLSRWTLSVWFVCAYRRNPSRLCPFISLQITPSRCLLIKS